VNPDPPGHTPDIVTALLQRLVAPSAGPARAARQPGEGRDQVHSLVDQLIDVGATLSAMISPTQASVREALRGSARAVTGIPRLATGPGTAAPLNVLPLGPVRPGATTVGELSVSNDSREPRKGLRLRCAALVSETEARIAGEALSVTPNRIDLAPRSSRIVDVTVTVPADATPGTYVGLLSAAGEAGIRTLVLLEVL
jgi:hypothetical protein